MIIIIEIVKGKLCKHFYKTQRQDIKISDKKMLKKSRYEFLYIVDFVFDNGIITSPKSLNTCVMIDGVAFNVASKNQVWLGTKGS